jgi:hypothetical protein
MNKKEILKNNLFILYNSNYDLLTLYRNSIKYNNSLRIYIKDDLYKCYEQEIYNVLDEYLYGELENQENVKKSFYQTIKIIIQNL